MCLKCVQTDLHTNWTSGTEWLQGENYPVVMYTYTITQNTQFDKTQTNTEAYTQNTHTTQDITQDITHSYLHNLLNTTLIQTLHICKCTNKARLSIK